MVSNVRSLNNIKTLTKIKQTLENDRYRFKLLESSEEPTAYSWLTTTPLIEHVFYLDKTTFWDSIRIRYDIPPKYLPSRCVCRGENSRWDIGNFRQN